MDTSHLYPHIYTYTATNTHLSMYTQTYIHAHPHIHILTLDHMAYVYNKLLPNNPYLKLFEDPNLFPAKWVTQPCNRAYALNQHKVLILSTSLYIRPWIQSSSTAIHNIYMTHVADAKSIAEWESSGKDED